MCAHRRTLSVTPQARRDYDDILVYTEQTWGPEQADRYEVAIDRAMNVLLRHPYIGYARDDLALGLRSSQAEHHVIFFPRQARPH